MATNSRSFKRQKGYMVDFKVFVVDRLRAHQRNLSQTSQEFGVCRKRIREWDQKYTFLKQHNKGAVAKKRRLGDGQSPLSKELDEKLFEDARSEGLAVSNKLLLGELGLQSFKCSSGWLHRWKARYNVGYRCGTNTSQKIPADYADQIFKVRKEIIKMRKKHVIEPSQIYNMDQTMCRFDMPQNRTNTHCKK